MWSKPYQIVFSKTRTEEAEDRSNEGRCEEGLDELLPRGTGEQQQHHPGGPQTSTPHPTVKHSWCPQSLNLHSRVLVVIRANPLVSSVANSTQPDFRGW